MTTRREFLSACGGAAVAAFGCGCEIDGVARLVDDAMVITRLGVLANVDRIRSVADQKLIEKALRHFRLQNAEAVILAERLTRRDVFDEAWHRVFGYSSKVRLICEEGSAKISGFPFAVAFQKPTRKGASLTFHGDGRMPLTDDLAFIDPTYRSVYAGSMSGFTIPEGFVLGGKPAAERTEVPCAQGLFVSVYADMLEIRRLDFTQSVAEDVAPPIVLSRTGSWKRAETKAPEFWPNTVLQVIPGYEKDVRVTTVKWPNIQRRFTGVRAFCYEVTVSLLQKGTPARPFRHRNILSGKCHLAESRDDMLVTCKFRDEDFASAREGDASVVISVTPVGSCGDRGKPLRSAPFKP